MNENSETQWLSISDLMSVLMLVFLLISISYMVQVSISKEKIQKAAVKYDSLQIDLYHDLYDEFSNDLSSWDAEIDSNTLSVKFLSPKILFDRGSSEIKQEFAEILIEFFPRYLAIIMSEKYKKDIEEVRIEGHTSSYWENSNAMDAYIKNMELSQDRTRNVLAFCLERVKNNESRNWLIDKLTSNGLSSSKLILVDGIEVEKLSRRVEFRVKTDADKAIVSILKGN